MNWVPYSNTGTAVKPYDAYSFRSNMNAGLNFNFLPRNERGDYYPLTEFDLGKDVWCAYQLYKPEEGKGFIMAFRREEAADSVFTAALGGIDPASSYRFYNFDTEEVMELKGADLVSNGFAIALDHPRSSALIKIEKI